MTKVLVNKFLLLAFMLSMMGLARAQSISYNTSFDLSTGLTLDNVYSVSTEESAPFGMEFSPDGLKLFIVGQTDAVHQYTLTTAFDITSSITYDGSYSLSTEDNTPVDITFTPDGMTMFMLGQSSRTVFEYTLSSAFDITSTVTKTANSFAMGFRAPFAHALSFSTDGMILWVATNGSIQEFDLSTAYGIATASTSANLDELDGILGTSVNIYDFQFSGDGGYLYLLTGLSNYELIEYELPSSYDILSGVTETASFNPANEETVPRAFSITPSGNRFHLLGQNGDDVNQYDSNIPSYFEGLANDAGIDGSFRMFALDGDTFTSAGGTLTSGVDFSISNLPSGLTPVIEVASDGSSGTLYFTGNASDHQFSDGVSDLVFTFNNSAFVGGDASAISNATAANSGISITFRDNSGPFLSYDTYGDFSSALKESTTFSVVSEEPTPQAVAFSNDGLKAFVVGSSNDAVFQYTLTNPFDITSGVSYSTYSVDVSTEELGPLGLTFNMDGTKMYLVGSGNEVNQYSLSTGFDLNSTVTSDGSPFDLSSDMTSPQGIAFNPDGTKMFICGTSAAAGWIFEYTLTSPYDVTMGGSLSNSIEAEGFFLTDLKFDTDGNTLYGTVSNTIKEYSLPAPYTISYGVSLAESHTTGVLGSTGFHLNSDRSGFFVISSSTDAINQFNSGKDIMEESYTNDGSVNSTQTIKIIDGLFANTGGSLTHGVDFTVTGTPSGLTPQLTVASDGLSAELSFTGTASSHSVANNVSDLVFTFSNSAFNGNDASEVINAVGASSYYNVNFIDPKPVVFVDGAFDITGNLDAVGSSLDLRPQSSTPFNPTFSLDGSTLFVIDQTNDAIDQYTLSTPFEGITGTYSTTHVVSTEESIPTTVQFSDDGTKMFVMGTSTDKVHQYTLTTPFDLSGGVSYDNVSFNVTTVEASPMDLHFSPTGQRMYIVGQGSDAVHQYKLPKAFDLSVTPIYAGSFSISSYEASVNSLYISPDGSKLMILGQSNDRVYQFELTEAFDITTAVYNIENFGVNGFDSSPTGITFSSDGYHMYTGGTNFDRLRQLDLLLTTDFTETVDNQGEVDGSFSVGIISDKFSNAGSTLTYLTDYTVTDVPTGLTPVMTISADGLTATLTFTGSATNHQNINDVSSFEIEFLDGAFFGGDASNVINATMPVDLRIDFINNPSLTYINGYNLSNGGRLKDLQDISNNEVQPTGIALNDDGSKMYIVGASGDEINQYSLSVPYDITSSFSLDGVVTMTNPNGITFNGDGTLGYILFQAGSIIQYELSTPYDFISSPVNQGGITVSTQDSSPQGFAISVDGDKLFMVGGTNDAVYQYTIDNLFNISAGASYDNVSFSVAGQETQPTDVQFNPDGTKMFITGSLSDQIHQYSLTTAYDLTTGVSYDGVVLDVSDESSPSGFAFGDSGSKIFVSGAGGQSISQYDLTSDGFSEASLNNGEVEGIQGIQLNYETFVNAGGTLTENTHYTLTGLPSGLTSSIAVDAAGSFATLTLSGQVTDHQDVDDIASLEISFLDAAFDAGTTAGIANVTNQTISGIDFDDNNASLTYGDLYDLNKLSYTGTSTTTNASEDGGMLGLAFSNDGMTLFLAGNSTDAIYQYTMNSPFNVEAGFTYSGKSFSTASEETFPVSLAFSNDGSRMFVLGALSNDVHQYNLSTPFDLSGGVTFVDSFDASFYDQGSSGLTFNPDGTKMYIASSTSDEINQYSLATPFDISTGVTFDGYPLSFGSQQSNPQGIVFSPDGLNLFLLGGSGDRIEHFVLETAFDLTDGAEYVGNFPIFDQDTAPSDLVFSSDGSRLIIIGGIGDDLNQYDFNLDQFEEGAKNDGSLTGTQTIYIHDEQFVNAGGQLSHSVDFTINNLPSGLSPILTVDANGTSAVLSFEDAATNHQDINDINGLEFTFNNSAFVNGDASSVSNANTYTSPFDMDFRDNNPIVLYGDPLNMANATYTGNSFDLSTEDTYPTGLAFNADGTKMYVAGGNNSKVFEYTLSVAYDLSSTVTYTGNSLDLTTNAQYPEDLYFSADGTRLMILSSDNYEVVQYNLSTGFDLSSATYSGNSLSVEIIDQSSYGFSFSPDGTKMYLGGADNEKLYQYVLTNPFDISTATYGNDFIDISNEEYSPTGIVISNDGRFILIVGDGLTGAVRYILNVPFDLSAGATYDGTAFDLNPVDDGPSGLAMTPNGNRIIMVGTAVGELFQYDINIGGFTEAVANDGTLEGSLKVSIIDEPFTNEGGNFTYGVDYTIPNLPSGLTPTLNVDADGYSATLTLSGSASPHGDNEDVDGLNFTFNNSAFEGGNAAAVGNTSNYDSGLDIDFSPYIENNIISFTFAEIDGSATIDAGLYTVVAEAVAGTDISAISPTITTSQSSTISPDTGVEQDFTYAVTYTVTAEDGTPQDWEVTITEALATPTDIVLDNSSINENGGINDAVGYLSTVDASFNDSFTYSLVAGTGDTDNATFNINGDELRAGVSLDFETKSSYTIRIQTDDNNGGLFEKAFVITVTDVNEIPTDITLDNNSIDESNPVGTVIGGLTTTDEDLGQSYTYSLVAGTGDTDNASFSISGTNLVSAEEYDFETKTSYSVRILTDDNQGGTYEKAFAISINDLPSQITSIQLSNSLVNENEVSGTTVGSFSTFGEDLTGSYTYSLATGAGDTDNGSFTISGDQLLTAASFDFETKDSYSILVMSDDGNLSGTQQLTISISDVSEAPTDISLSANSITENNVIGDGIGTFTTTDEDAGESYSYSLVTGTGDTDNASFAIVGDELQAAAIFDFETKNSYSVRVETNDGNGGTFAKAFTVTINDENESILVVNPNADQDLLEYFATLDIDFGSVFEDQDNDPLTYEVSSSDETIVTVSYVGTLLTITEVGGFGSSTITITADDGSGITNSDEFIVTVSNVNDTPVVANATADQDVNEDFGSLDIDLSSTFTDKDNDALTLSASSDDETVVTASMVGDLLTLTEVGNGTATITITADDGNGGIGTDEFVIVVNNVNDAPVVANATADQDLNEDFGTSDIDLSSTFFDEDGDALTLSAQSSDETVVTVSIAGSTLTLTEAGNGTSTITVTANDGNGEMVSDEFIVTVNNVNDAPVVANATADQTEDEGFGSIQLDLSATFSDEEGDALTLSASSGDETVVTVSMSGNLLTITEVGNGSATITVTANDGNGGSGSDEFVMTVNNVNDAPIVTNAIADQNEDEGFGSLDLDLSTTFSDEDGDALTLTATSSDETVVTVVISGSTLTITEAGFGSATITVTADDGNGASVADDFTITVTEVPNDAPIVANPIADVNVDEGFGSSQISLTDVFTDADGDALTLTVSSSDETVVTATISGDQLQIAEVGLGTSTITVTADDGNGGSVSDDFTFTVSEIPNNAPIVANPIADAEAEEGFGSSQISLTDVFIDADGDALTLTASSSDETVVTATISGDQLQITEVGLGTSTITVTADDGNGGSVSDDFTFTVNEFINTHPVVANPIADAEAEEGFGSSQISLTDVFTDADGHSLTLTVSSSDETVVTATISGDQLQITEVGLGTSTITVTADDGNGGSVSDDFTFTVTEKALGLEDELSLKVYPNPVVESLNIESDNEVSAMLSDLNGRELQRATGRSIKMDVNSLSKGIYLITITKGDETIKKRIIKAN